MVVVVVVLHELLLQFSPFREHSFRFCCCNWKYCEQLEQQFHVKKLATVVQRLNGRFGTIVNRLFLRARGTHMQVCKINSIHQSTRMTSYSREAVAVLQMTVAAAAGDARSPT